MTPNLFNHIEVKNKKEETKKKEEIELSNSLKIKELLNISLDELVEKLEFFVKSDILSKDDFLYNYAYDRGFKIENSIFKNDELELRLAPVSESEKMLRAYEENENIKPLDFLNLDLPEITKGILKNAIDENLNISTLELMKMFKIFDYPHFRPCVSSSSRDELFEVLELMKMFNSLVIHNLVDVESKKFRNLRATRNRKQRTPACFDGNCLDKKLSGDAKNASYFGRETSF